MRILVDYRPALRERTGVGEYVHQAATALVATARPGESVVLFSASWKDRLPAGVVPGAQTVDRAIPVRVLNWCWHRLEWPPVEYLGGGTLDITQSAHPLLLPTTGAARIVTVHDLDFLDHPERTRAEIRRDYPELSARHVTRADQVIAVSQHTASEVETRLRVPRARISICSPGVPLWARREAEPPTGGGVLFLGTLEPRKNVAVLLDAYERLLARWPAAPQLVLAGRVTPEAEALVARTRRLPLAGHVDVVGYVQPEQRLDLYRRALVFVLPSHTEGFGMPAAEAMMTGVPVIVSNRGALPEVVGTAGRLIDPTNAEALAEALFEILHNPVMRRHMSDAGRQHVEQFTWNATATRMREAWSLALEHREQRRG